MFLCCLFLSQSFGDVSPYVCSLLFSSVWVAEGRNCPFGWPFVLIVLCQICNILVISHFGFVNDIGCSVFESGF